MKMHRRHLVFLQSRWAQILIAVLIGAGLGAGTCTAQGPHDPGATTAVGASNAKGASSGYSGSGMMTKGTESFREKRDPFKTPPPPQPDQSPFMGPLPAGKRGLVIGRLRLDGVVSEGNGKQMIAVVTNQTHRAYFLRPHDEVYNGVVEKITADSIQFREKRPDSNGRFQTAEVVLKLARTGEGK